LRKVQKAGEGGQGDPTIDSEFGTVWEDLGASVARCVV